MPVNLSAPTELLAVAGIRLAAVAAGIKKNRSADLTLIDIADGSHVSAVFTSNRFRAAPVLIAERNLKSLPPRMLLINSGNANAGTGEQGIQDAQRCCRIAADVGGYPPAAILPFSTGVIGEPLPVEKFEQGIPDAYQQLSEHAWLDAAQGIMTTDTVAKGISKTIDIDGCEVVITGIAKGSGMIRPDMATMLAYVASNVCIDKSLLDRSLQDVVNNSFNSITVDGDTSTNDSCVLIATNQASHAPLQQDSESYNKFIDALESVFQYLAQAIIRDAEGVNKFVSIMVEGAQTVKDAREVAFTVAHSPLVKTALFASDANWGRILAAVGRAPVSNLDVDKVDIYLGDVCIVSQGSRAPTYKEESGQQVMSQPEITICIKLNEGDQNTTVWTSDLSYDYVRINAEYRT